MKLLEQFSYDFLKGDLKKRKKKVRQLLYIIIRIEVKVIIVKVLTTTKMA